MDWFGSCGQALINHTICAVYRFPFGSMCNMIKAIFYSTPNNTLIAHLLCIFSLHAQSDSMVESNEVLSVLIYINRFVLCHIVHQALITEKEERAKREAKVNNKILSVHDIYKLQSFRYNSVPVAIKISLTNKLANTFVLIFVICKPAMINLSNQLICLFMLAHR